MFVCIRNVRSAALQHRKSSLEALTGRGPSTTGTVRLLPLLIPVMDRAQRQRPKGMGVDRSEREGRVAEGLFRATLDDARFDGRWWLGVRIGPGLKYVSAQSPKRSVEQFGGWVHASGAQLGNLRGERRWTAAVLHPGVVETVVQATKAAKQSHSAAASVWVMLRGPG